MHGSCYISLFKFKSFDSFNSPQTASNFRHLLSCGTIAKCYFERKASDAEHKTAFSNGVERMVVLSNDTDVVVLLLFYIFDLLFLGLKECWIRVGTGEIKKQGSSPSKRMKES